MNNLSDFANFGELQIFFWGGGGRGRGAGGGARRKSAPRAPKALATPLVPIVRLLYTSAVAQLGGWGPSPPPRFQKRFFYWFHWFNVQYMYMHIKL